MSLQVKNPFEGNTGGGGGNTGDLPNASTSQKGVVQLSNAIDSQNQNMAATSKAVDDAIADANNYADTLFTQLNIVHEGSTPPPNTAMFWNKP